MTDNAHVKQGMLALVECRHRYMSLQDRLKEWTTFHVGIVLSVNREGLAKSVWLANGRTITQCEWHSILVDYRSMIRDEQTLLQQLTDWSYDTRDEALSVIKAIADY
jgi:hypothetical protein